MGRIDGKVFQGKGICVKALWMKGTWHVPETKKKANIYENSDQRGEYGKRERVKLAGSTS